MHRLLPDTPPSPGAANQVVRLRPLCEEALRSLFNPNANPNPNLSRQATETDGNGTSHPCHVTAMAAPGVAPMDDSDSDSDDGDDGGDDGGGGGGGLGDGGGGEGLGGGEGGARSDGVRFSGRIPNPAACPKSKSKNEKRARICVRWVPGSTH